jgi:hypothetical protein
MAMPRCSTRLDALSGDTFRQTPRLTAEFRAFGLEKLLHNNDDNPQQPASGATDAGDDLSRGAVEQLFHVNKQTAQRAEFNVAKLQAIIQREREVTGGCGSAQPRHGQRRGDQRPRKKKS